MNRVLDPNRSQWFHGLSAVAFYSEMDVERMILQHAQNLFSDHYVFPFKQQISSNYVGATKKPDLAMVRHDLAAWTVVEVELSGHLLDHVMDQVRVFKNGDYNAVAVAKYVSKQIKSYCGKEIAEGKLRKLVDAETPSVLVIVDQHEQTLAQALKADNVDLCVFEIYKSTKAEYLLRTIGPYPRACVDQVHCKRASASLPNTFEVIGELRDNVLQHEGRLEVSFNETLTPWEVFKSSEKFYLRYLGKSNPLSLNHCYALCRDRDGSLFFKPI